MPIGLFATALYQQVADPHERILAYINFRSQIVQSDLADVTCLLGTMVQETFDSHPAIRVACREAIESHARTLVPMIAEAKSLYAPDADWTAESLAPYTQAARQGGGRFSHRRSVLLAPAPIGEWLADVKSFLAFKLNKQ